MQKRGESQQIATILLVAFVITMLIIVFLWGRNYIQEKIEKEGKLAEKQLECESIEFEVVNAYYQGSRIISTLKNEKERGIDKFTFRIIGNEVEAIESYSKLDNLTIKQYELRFQEEKIGIPAGINIIPWLKVARGYYIPCSKKNIEVKIANQ